MTEDPGIYEVAGMMNLKPCPFCGKKPASESSGLVWVVYCGTKVAPYSHGSFFRRSAKGASIAWNKRWSRSHESPA